MPSMQLLLCFAFFCVMYENHDHYNKIALLYYWCNRN